TGFVKNDPALKVSGSAGSSTMPLPRRSPSTAARTSVSGARAPTCTASRLASSAYWTGTDIGSRASANVTSSTTYLPVGPELEPDCCRAVGPGLEPDCCQPVRLNMLVRYPNPQAEPASAPTAFVARSSTVTEVAVAATSWP